MYSNSLDDIYSQYGIREQKPQQNTSIEQMLIQEFLKSDFGKEADDFYQQKYNEFLESRNPQNNQSNQKLENLEKENKNLTEQINKMNDTIKELSAYIKQVQPPNGFPNHNNNNNINNLPVS